MLGTYYPRNGSRNLARAIIPVIQEAGGDVVTSARAIEILTTDNVATGVKVEIEGQAVIVNGRFIIAGKALWKVHPIIYMF